MAAPIHWPRYGLGAVLVLSDRTDLDDLGRELEATRGLTDALRAQAHEFNNRLHALSGMLELGLFDNDPECRMSGGGRSDALG